MTYEMTLPQRLAATIALLLALASPAAAGQIGIVMLHGLNGVPLGEANEAGRTVGGQLIPALRKAGYLVATPELCFSHRRVFDRTFEGCFDDVDAAVAALRAKGAATILVGGESLGSLLAFGYAAAHPEIAGVIACAPGGDAERVARQPAIRSALADARAAVAAGHGDDVQSFPESNTGPRGHYDFTVRTTPRIYLSFLDPDGPGSLDGEVARVSVPVLWVAGSRDGGQPASAPGVLNANPLTQFVTVDADHLGTPDAGTAAILAWLARVAALN
jgi:pimeloyl-ACP methyl ester carboxylesterase